jgi:hypothetical protein
VFSACERRCCFFDHTFWPTHNFADTTQTLLKVHPSPEVFKLPKKVTLATLEHTFGGLKTTLALFNKPPSRSSPGTQKCTDYGLCAHDFKHLSHLPHFSAAVLAKASEAWWRTHFAHTEVKKLLTIKLWLDFGSIEIENKNATFILGHHLLACLPLCCSLPLLILRGCGCGKHFLMCGKTD